MYLQYVVPRQKVTKYVAKYATKSEPRSKALQEVYRSISGVPLSLIFFMKVVQKLLTSTVGERNFSAQETCHILLMLPMVRSSRNFVVLSLDGSREMDDNLEADKPVTVESQLDHYCARPDTGDFNQLTLLDLSKSTRKAQDPKEERCCIRSQKEGSADLHVLIAHQIQTDHN